MRAYDPQAPLVSLHIPKTAGTSFRATLDEWFSGRLKLHYAERSAAPEKHVLAAGDCVHGHFNRLRGIGAKAYYPEVDQFTIFFRRPFERAVSQWKYLQYQRQAGWPLPALAGVETFDDWIRMRTDRFAPLEDPFSMFAHLPEPVRLEELEVYLSENFVAIGAVEDYPYAIQRVGTALGKFDSSQIFYLNERRDSSDLGLNARDFDAFFEAETALYDAAVRVGRVHTHQHA